MTSTIAFNHHQYPRLKVSGKDQLPKRLTLQDKLLITGEVFHCASQIPATVGSGLYYYVSIVLPSESLNALQNLALESGHTIDPTVFNLEQSTVTIKKRGITYNKPVPRVQIFDGRDSDQTFPAMEDLPKKALVRVAATIKPNQCKNKATFGLTLGVIQLLELP